MENTDLYIWHVSPVVPREYEYDVFEGMVVIAASEEDARNMNPATGQPTDWPEHGTYWAGGPQDLKVQLIGTASEGSSSGVVMVSFRHG